MLFSSRIPRTRSVALFSDRSPRALCTHTRYTFMNIFSNGSSSSIAMLHWGGTPLLCNDPQRRQYLDESYTGRQSQRTIDRAGISFVLVSSCVDNYQQTCGQHGMYCRTACCFYATYGEHHTSKTCRVHQLTALLPLDGQLSRTYKPITTAVVKKYLDRTKLLLECRCKYKMLCMQI